MTCVVEADFSNLLSSNQQMLMVMMSMLLKMLLMVHAKVDGMSMFVIEHGNENWDVN